MQIISIELIYESLEASLKSITRRNVSVLIDVYMANSGQYSTNMYIIIKQNNKHITVADQY